MSRGGSGDGAQGRGRATVRPRAAGVLPTVGCLSHVPRGVPVPPWAWLTLNGLSRRGHSQCSEAGPAPAALRGQAVCLGRAARRAALHAGPSWGSRGQAADERQVHAGRSPPPVHASRPFGEDRPACTALPNGHRSGGGHQRGTHVKGQGRRDDFTAGLCVLVTVMTGRASVWLAPLGASVQVPPSQAVPTAMCPWLAAARLPRPAPLPPSACRP